MKNALFLILGLTITVVLAPNESQSQPKPGEVPPGQHGQPNALPSTKSTLDPMEMFERISGGKSSITAADLAGLDSLKADFQAYLGTAGGGGDHVTREDFFALVEWRKEQQRLQREWLLKQIEVQREMLLAGDDTPLTGMPAMPAMPGAKPFVRPSGDPTRHGHNQPNGHDDTAAHHEPAQELTPEQWQQQVAMQQWQQAINAEVENTFRGHRLNKDGNITKEAAEPQLKAQWDAWDFDGNDQIDLEEYKAFKSAERMGWRPTKDGPNPFRPSWAADPRTPVYRKGKLPSGLPSWFADLADNEEGQIFLYDWRQAGRKDEEFFAMDLNGDGILTAAEVLDFMKRAAAAATSILIVQSNANTVSEIGPDGKVRWILSGLTNPRDVELLQKGVVLVAEQNQVSERTTTGKVVWKYQVNEPQSAQRLANGHTFIVCPDRIVEVDRGGREVMTITINIAAARRMADGRIIAFDRQRVIQLDAQGQILKTAQCNCGGGGRNEIMENGHVLALSPGNGNIIEFDGDGAEIGRFDYQGAGYGFRLPGGHVFVTNQNGNEYLELDENWKLVKTTALLSPAIKVKAGKPTDTAKGSGGSGSGSPR